MLVISSLTNQITELSTSLIICLEPNKNILKCADPRFYKGADKCSFILTKGAEENVSFGTRNKPVCNVDSEEVI